MAHMNYFNKLRRKNKGRYLGGIRRNGPLDTQDPPNRR